MYIVYLAMSREVYVFRRLSDARKRAKWLASRRKCGVIVYRFIGRYGPKE